MVSFHEPFSNVLWSACVLNQLIVLPDLNMDHYLATDPSKASWLGVLNRHKSPLAGDLLDISSSSYVNRVRTCVSKQLVMEFTGC